MASDSKPHLQIFKPDQGLEEHSTFHFFPQLAKELRDKIWMHALERQRIIHLTVHDPVWSAGMHGDPEGTTSFPENGETFWVMADGHQTMSKLFRTDSESREAAISFYRVRIPCQLKTIGGAIKWGTIYINPENDFVRISPTLGVKNTLFNFMYHLKNTYDPHGIGLCNLVTTTNDLNANDLHAIDPSDPGLDEGHKMAFKQIMGNLRQVIFYSNIRAGRQVLTWHTGVFTDKIFYNRSFPIEARVPTFDRLPRDPRTISKDLKNIYVGNGDCRDQIHLWHRVLKDWSISCPGIEYKWHIAFEPQEKISDRTSANKFMQKEEDYWHGIKDPAPSPFSNIDFKTPIGAETEEYKNEDLEAAVKPAFGFWLFPIDVLEPIGKNEVTVEQGFHPDHLLPVLWDFSDSWPELWVANLPGKAD